MHPATPTMACSPVVLGEEMVLEQHGLDGVTPVCGRERLKPVLLGSLELPVPAGTGVGVPVRLLQVHRPPSDVGHLLSMTGNYGQGKIRKLHCSQRDLGHLLWMRETTVRGRFEVTLPTEGPGPPPVDEGNYGQGKIRKLHCPQRDLGHLLWMRETTVRRIFGSYAVHREIWATSCG